jgi:RNA polymerase sigma-70 factor (ECF subfamily)
VDSRQEKTTGEDRTLAARILKGDEDAFEEMVKIYGPRIFSFGFRLCGRRHDAEDLVQDVFLSALKSLDRYRGEAPLLSWLFTIGAHRCQRMRRTRSGEPRIKASLEQLREIRQDPASTGPDALHVLESKDAHERMARAIAQLPPDLKKVLVLRDLEEQDTSGAAKILGISRAAVKSRLHRARLELKRRILP